ncbi:GIY-YIG nuclease family protein [uncultured Algoriphagus sp.]|jgi:putative endonuclease|uniref:GIY-YIG nuclease family protein n=3 Tax=Algoriphagus TaxID=246875 RepID=UPI0030D9E56E
MEFVVYILFSERLGKYYVGQTSDLDKRLKRHNSGRERFTRLGTPWVLVHSELTNSRAEAMKLEKKIKNLGAKRYLELLKRDG